MIGFHLNLTFYSKNLLRFDGKEHIHTEFTKNVFKEIKILGEI